MRIPDKIGRWFQIALPRLGDEIDERRCDQYQTWFKLIGGVETSFASPTRVGDGKSAFCSWQLRLRFRRVINNVTTSPFQTAGETNEETRPGRNDRERETDENKYDPVASGASLGMGP